MAPYIIEQTAYSFFGVKPTASPFEIQEAYQRQARKFSPDKVWDTPMASVSKTGMQEVDRWHALISTEEARQAYDAQLEEKARPASAYSEGEEGELKFQVDNEVAAEVAAEVSVEAEEESDSETDEAETAETTEDAKSEHKASPVLTVLRLHGEDLPDSPSSNPAATRGLFGGAKIAGNPFLFCPDFSNNDAIPATPEACQDFLQGRLQDYLAYTYNVRFDKKDNPKTTTRCALVLGPIHHLPPSKQPPICVIPARATPEELTFESLMDLLLGMDGSHAGVNVARLLVALRVKYATVGLRTGECFAVWKLALVADGVGTGGLAIAQELQFGMWNDEEKAKIEQDEEEEDYEDDEEDYEGDEEDYEDDEEGGDKVEYEDEKKEEKKAEKKEEPTIGDAWGHMSNLFPGNSETEAEVPASHSSGALAAVGKVLRRCTITVTIAALLWTLTAAWLQVDGSQLASAVTQFGSKTAYEHLGLPNDDSLPLKTIRGAYHKTIAVYHPDKQMLQRKLRNVLALPQPDETEVKARIYAIIASYAILKNPYTRCHYDNWRIPMRNLNYWSELKKCGQIRVTEEVVVGSNAGDFDDLLPDYGAVARVQAAQMAVYETVQDLLQSILHAAGRLVSWMKQCWDDLTGPSGK